MQEGQKMSKSKKKREMRLNMRDSLMQRKEVPCWDQPEERKEKSRGRNEDIVVLL